MFPSSRSASGSQNTDGSADECEYTYHELIKVLNGETKPEDYAGVSSAYKLLANDVSVIKDTVPGYEKDKQLSIEDFSTENFKVTSRECILCWSATVRTLRQK